MERIEKLQQLLNASPDDCFLLHALGLEHNKLNDTARAIDFFKKVLAVDENYTGTYYHLAKAYEKTGNEALAIATYEKGILIATAAKDQHARNELLMALEEITD